MDQAQAAGGGRGRPNILPAPVIGFCFLTLNCAMAAWRSRDDPWTLAFVVAAYTDLLLLFHCIRLLDRAPPGSPQRRQLKAAVWALMTLLTAMLTHKVAAIMPPPVEIFVWALGWATVGSGFYCFFVYHEAAA